MGFGQGVWSWGFVMVTLFLAYKTWKFGGDSAPGKNSVTKPRGVGGV